MRTTQTTTDGIMASAGATQSPEGTWVARCGIYPTVVGMGPTAAKALCSLRRKVEKLQAHRAKS